MTLRGIFLALTPSQAPGDMPLALDVINKKHALYLLLRLITITVKILLIFT